MIFLEATMRSPVPTLVVLLLAGPLQAQYQHAQTRSFPRPKPAIEASRKGAAPRRVSPGDPCCPPNGP